MKIIIPRVPPSTTRKDVVQAVNRTLSKNLIMRFRRDTALTSVKVIKIRDSKGIVEYFGLIEMRSDKVGKWFVANFRNQRIRNKLVAAREFKERRADHPAFIGAANRRRPNLEVEIATDPSEQYQGLREFVRSYAEA